MAVELLAGPDGELDGYRILIHLAAELAAPWTAGYVERTGDREMLAEPTEDGGTYDTAQIIRDAAITANELLAWSKRHPAGDLTAVHGPRLTRTSRKARS